MINKDFKEFIALLNKNHVKYLVVGGYALAFHGYPRYTKDIDFWVWVDKKNAENIIKTLHDFGFSSLDIKEEDFMSPGYVVQLGQPPSRIDLLTSVTGLEFEDCYATKVHVNIQGSEVDFIDLENFKKNKKAVGRHQDLADLENLE
jgi:predicted nucleotidyltransferase